MATFNGHKNWNHWNVSLWLHNEEPLYAYLLRCSRFQDGPKRMLNWLGGKGSTTPDGAPYSLSAIRAAMKELD